jgi:hypothetical protein
MVSQDIEKGNKKLTDPVGKAFLSTDNRSLSNPSLLQKLLVNVKVNIFWPVVGHYRGIVRVENKG